MKEIINQLFPNWTETELRSLLIIITALGILVAILTFIIERIVSSRSSNKRNKRQWLLEIIIKPEIENIKNIFQLLEKNSIKNLKKVNKIIRKIDSLQKSKNFSEIKELEDKLRLIQAKKISKFKRNVNSNSRTFIALIEEYDNSVGSQLLLLMNELVDKHTDTIGLRRFDIEFCINGLRHAHRQIRAKFFYEIYKIVP